MSLSSATRRRLVIVIAIAVIALGSLPAGVAAQSETGVSGTIVVEEGETVDEVSAVAGTVVVRGTVEGDVSAFAGNVYVDGGTVAGDVSAAAGNVEIAGTVDGSVSVAAGNLVVTEDGSIGGSLEAGAGNVRIDGSVAGDATIGADRIVLGEGAAIDGDLRYDGDLEGNTDAVAGEITQDSAVGVEIGPSIGPFASWLFAAYAFVLNLLLGAALLLLFPRFSASVADRVATEPVRTGLVGLLVFVGTPLLLALVGITIVGLPITVVGAFAFALLVWLGIVYGRFAVGVWLLSLVDAENRWIALVGGLLLGALVGQIPIVGGLINLLVFLLGLGALSAGVVGRRRRDRDSAAPTPAEETATG